MIMLVSENGNKGTLHKRAYKAKEKEPDRGRSDVYRESLVETRTTPGSLSETLQTTALPSSTTVPRPQHLAIAPTRYTWLQWISILGYFRIFFCAEAYSAHAYS